MGEAEQGTETGVNNVKLGNHEQAWLGWKLGEALQCLLSNTGTDAMTIIRLTITDKHLASHAFVYVTFGLHLVLSNIQQFQFRRST